MNINDKTTIPLFAALLSLPVIIGGILWLTSVDAKATKAAESADLISEIHIKVIKIEKDVEFLKEKRKK